MTWRRILLLTSAFVLLLLGGTWLLLRHTGAAQGLVQAALARVLATDFSLRDAIVDLADGTLTLEQLEIADPRPNSGPLLKVERVRVGVDTNPLGDVLAVNTVTLEGLELHIDLVSGEFPSLDGLLRTRGVDTGASRSLPPIRLSRSRVTLVVHRALPPLLLDQVELQLRPDPDGDGSTLVGSLRLHNFDVPLQLDGSGDLVKGQLLVTARSTAIVADGDWLARVRDFLPAAMPIAELGADLDKLTLWFGLTPGHGRPDAGFAAELSEVGCTVPSVGYRTDHATIRLSATTDQGGQGRFHLLRTADGPQLDVQGTVTGLLGTPELELRGTGRRVPLDAEVQRALGSFRAGRNVIAALAPSAGEADFALRLQRPGADDEVVELDLEVRDASMRYLGFGSPPRVSFPLPLEAVHGQVQLRGDEIRLLDIRGLVAADAGGGTVTCSGAIEMRRAGGDAVSLDIEAPALKFNSATRAALAELLHDGGALYDEFQPGGEAAVRVAVRPTATGNDWRVEVLPRGVSLNWQRFPLRIDDLGGTILARAEGIEFALDGRHGGPVRANGRLLSADGSDPTGGRIELNVQATDLRLDQSVADALLQLAPETVPVWHRLQPSGTFDATATVVRPHSGTPAQYDVRIDLDDAQMQPPELQMPIRAVNGTLFVRGSDRRYEVEIDTVRAAVSPVLGRPPVQLAVLGTARGGLDAADEFTGVARNLWLGPELADLCVRLDLLDREALDTLALSGGADAVVQLRRDPRGVDTRLTMHLRDVRSDAELLPRPATGVHGTVQVRDGAVTFEELLMRVGDSEVRAWQGSVRRDPDSGRQRIAFQMSSTDFPVDDNLARLFQGPLRQTVLDRRLHGRMGVERLQLAFLVPTATSSGPFTTRVEGRLEARGVQMVMGTRVDNLHGFLDLDASSEISSFGGAIRGTIGNATMRLFGHTIDTASCRFRADAEQIELHDLECGWLGGAVRAVSATQPALTYRFGTGEAPDGQPGVLSGEVLADGVPLYDLLKQSGMASVPWRGLLGGRIRLDELRGADFVHAKGGGEVRLSEGNLGVVPVFATLYAELAARNRPRFDSGSLRFELADRALLLHDVEVRSSLITVKGSGRFDLDGYLDLKVELDRLFGGSADILLLPPLLQSLTKQLVSFHMYGHWREIQMAQRWIGQGRPRRPALPPLPPRRDRPARPDY